MIKKFEKDIADIFKSGKIKAPIHLAGGNELQLKRIFKDYKKGDWIFSTWRSHYHWLLSGRGPQELINQIMDGYSMSVFGNKFFTSSIVAGNAPIALGVAMALKRKGESGHVWCFLGDMGARCGLSMECMEYAKGHDLPITYVIEDNNRSVVTKTDEIWGMGKKNKVIKYKYKPTYPHAGIGEKVLF